MTADRPDHDADATSDRISALLTSHPVIDGHNDLLWEAREQVGYDFDRLDIEAGGTADAHRPAAPARGRGRRAVLVGLRAGFPERRRRGERDARADRRGPPDGGEVCRSAGLRAHRGRRGAAWESGRIASLLGAEGGHSINNSLATLRMLHVLGVRYMTLTHNSNVDWADSATDEPVHGGLSAVRGRGGARDEPDRHARRPQSHVSPTRCATPCGSPRCRRSSATPPPGRSATARATPPTTSWRRCGTTTASAW